MIDSTRTTNGGVSQTAPRSDSAAWPFLKTLTDDGKKVFAEAAKGLIQVVAAAGCGVIYTGVTNGLHGTHIFKGLGTAIIAALFAHNTLWKPANINIVFGAKPSPTTTGASPKTEEMLGAPAGNLTVVRRFDRRDLFA